MLAFSADVCQSQLSLSITKAHHIQSTLSDSNTIRNPDTRLCKLLTSSLLSRLEAAQPPQTASTFGEGFQVPRYSLSPSLTQVGKARVACSRLVATDLGAQGFKTEQCAEEASTSPCTSCKISHRKTSPAYHVQRTHHSAVSGRKPEFRTNGIPSSQAPVSKRSAECRFPFRQPAALTAWQMSRRQHQAG